MPRLVVRHARRPLGEHMIAAGIQPLSLLKPVRVEAAQLKSVPSKNQYTIVYIICFDAKLLLHFRSIQSIDLMFVSLQNHTVHIISQCLTSGQSRDLLRFGSSQVWSWDDLWIRIDRRTHNEHSGISVQFESRLSRTIHRRTEDCAESESSYGATTTTPL